MKTRKDVSTVSEYIKNFPKPAQANLQLVRNAIKEIDPMIEETISYRMPTFKLNGKYLIYMGAFSTHIGLYPASDPMVKAIKGLEKYRVSRGTLKFEFGKPLPISLIKKVVKFRIKERTAEAVKKSKNKK